MKPILTRYRHIDPTTREVPPHLARKLRRADDFIKITVSVCDALLSGDPVPINPGATGLFVGTGFGPMQTNFEVLDLVLEEGRSSPFLFSHSVFNAAAGYIAEIHGIKGCAQTITDFSHPFLLALREASTAISSGRLQRCLVVQVETYSPLLDDSRQRFSPGCSPWPAGGVAWLLESSEVSQKGYRLENLEIDIRPSTPEVYLQRTEELTMNDSRIQTSDPLALARELTNYLAKDQPPKLHCHSNADFGTAQLLLHTI